MAASRRTLGTDTGATGAGSERARLSSIAERDRLAAAGPLGDPDLPRKVVDRIDGVADLFRRKIAQPLERSARALVLALLSAIVGTAAVVVLLVGAFRLASALLAPNEWIVHAVLGVLLVTLGVAVFWRKAAREP